MTLYTGGAGNDVANAVTGTLTGFSGGSVAQLNDINGDTFVGGGGADTIVAGASSDDFIYEAPSQINGLAESIDGGAGGDRLYVSNPGASATYDFRLAQVRSIEVVGFQYNATATTASTIVI